MKDLYEAIECLSAQLSVKLEHRAHKKGYPVHYTGYSIQPPLPTPTPTPTPATQAAPAEAEVEPPPAGEPVPEEAELPIRGPVKLFHTLVHLPRGYWANFQPRDTPEPDGQSWHIPIRRSDGVVRASFAQGLMLRRHGDGYAIFYGEEPLNSDHIDYLFEELQKPGPAGLHLAISRLWTVRFGHMPFSVAVQIESLKNVDHMDLIHDALQDERSRKQIDELIGNEPSLSAPPRLLKHLPRE